MRYPKRVAMIGAVAAMICVNVEADAAVRLGGREFPTNAIASTTQDEAAFNRQWAERVFGDAPEPFSFTYGGRPSSALVQTWKRELREERANATTLLRTLILTDPETGLEVRAVASIYTDLPGVDWTLYFTNKGTNETPVLEQVKAVDVMVAPATNTAAVLHRLRGSMCGADDWQPFEVPLAPGTKNEFGAVNGRSSADSPCFNLDLSLIHI